MRTTPQIISYMTLRKVVGLLALTLVPVLVLGSFILDPPPTLQISVSAYYYTSMRNVLEGVICGIAMFLMSYAGYTKADSIISKLSGLFALGIAFLPTSDTSSKGDLISILHYSSAAVFFTLLSYMSAFLFTRSSGTMTPEKKKRNRVYRVCGIILAISVAGIPIDGIPWVHERIIFLKPTLILETVALVAFGVSWLTKGELILKDQP
ncbi:MAG TPA: hypothetical protein VL547_18880, partial [Dinghuibacter sp.]|uniref:hypothetical protein n=1 Tax=Dinghuibacter sp. TaxID=2024697 RepID=UPI002CABB8E6